MTIMLVCDGCKKLIKVSEKQMYERLRDCKYAKSSGRKFKTFCGDACKNEYVRSLCGKRHTKVIV